MEDATISNDQEKERSGQRDRYPSVVTTDDLIFELGKKDVDRLNKEKLLEGLLKEKRKVESRVVENEKVKTDAEKVKADVEDQMSILKDSNQRYEENNRDLSNELVRIRQELAESIAKNSQLAEDFDREKNQLIAQYTTQLNDLNLSLEETRKPKKSPRKRKD